MKVAVLNLSGNVGKTTIACHLLQPRLPQATVFSVESVNVGAELHGLAVEKRHGRQFGELVDEVMLKDRAIVDVGASNVEEFLKRMQQYAGSHEEFDVFVVPVVREKKVQADSVNTVRALHRIGVPPDKVRLVFNRVEVDEDVQHEFAALFGLAQAEGSCLVDAKAVVYANEVYERLKAIGKTLGDVAADPVDYRARLRETTDAQAREQCVRMVALKRLAVTANRNLDDVFASLFR